MPQYDPLIEVSAERDLYALPSEERDALRSVLKDVAERKEPSSHPKTKSLEGQPGLFRVRVGDVRAICALQKPRLYILKVGKRNGVYESVDDLEVPDAAHATPS